MRTVKKRTRDRKWITQEELDLSRIASRLKVIDDTMASLVTKAEHKEDILALELRIEKSFTAVNKAITDQTWKFLGGLAGMTVFFKLLETWFKH